MGSLLYESRSAQAPINEGDFWSLDDVLDWASPLSCDNIQFSVSPPASDEKGGEGSRGSVFQEGFPVGFPLPHPTCLALTLHPGSIHLLSCYCVLFCHPYLFLSIYFIVRV